MDLYTRDFLKLNPTQGSALITVLFPEYDLDKQVSIFLAYSYFQFYIFCA